MSSSEGKLMHEDRTYLAIVLALLVIIGVCAILAAAWMYGEPVIAL
jgi:hypothetical protein